MVSVLYQIWDRYYVLLGFASGSVSLANLLEVLDTGFGVVGSFCGMLIALVSLYRLVFRSEPNEAKEE